MQLPKRFTALFLAALLMCIMDIAAYAQDVPDISKKGTISITMIYDNKPVSGGALTLYRAGQVNVDDGNYSYMLTDDFIDCNVNLADISSETLANEFAQYAGEHSLAGKTERIGNDGNVYFSDLEAGLYLLVQNEAADGYYKVTPFLVSVPMNENGAYIYDVVASPKVELGKKPVPVPTTPSTRMGGGIGYCTVKNKTFSYSMTRSQAEAALKAINVGEGATKSLGTLLLAALGGPVGSVVGLSVSVILNFIGGESTYVSHLKSFLNSGKSVAYFKFDTHCVNRGTMYGDPMYDYVVDNVRMTY